MREGRDRGYRSPIDMHTYMHEVWNIKFVPPETNEPLIRKLLEVNNLKCSPNYQVWLSGNCITWNDKHCFSMQSGVLGLVEIWYSFRSLLATESQNNKSEGRMHEGISHLLDQFGKKVQHVVDIVSLVTPLWCDSIVRR